MYLWEQNILQRQNLVNGLGVGDLSGKTSYDDSVWPYLSFFIGFGGVCVYVLLCFLTGLHCLSGLWPVGPCEPGFEGHAQH